MELWCIGPSQLVRSMQTKHCWLVGLRGLKQTGMHTLPSWNGPAASVPPSLLTGQEGRDPCTVQLLVRKVRNKLAGRIGDALLRYDRATGCYVDDLQHTQGNG